MHLWTYAVPFCLLLGMLTACNDTTGNASDETSTGNPNEESTGVTGGSGTGGREGATPGGNGCRQGASRNLALDEQTPAGFTPGDILSLIEGVHEQNLTWNDLEIASYGPEHGEQSLAVTITHQGTPRWVEYTREGLAPGWGSSDDGCRPIFEVDLAIHIHSAQGALNEQFTTTLYTRSSGAIELSFVLKPQDVMGSFAIAQVQQAGFMLSQLYFDMQFTAYTSSGQVRTRFERTESGGAFSVAGGREPLASWGPAPCPEGQVAVPLSLRVGSFSGNDAVSLLNSITTSKVMFSGTPYSRVGFAPFVSDGGFACAYDEAAKDDPSVPKGTVVAKGTIVMAGDWRLSSDDGRLDATWPITVRATPDGVGDLAELSIAFDASQIVESEPFAQRYGIHALAVPDLDFVNATLSLTIAPATGLRGTLRVSGYDRPVCSVSAAPEIGGSAPGGSCPAATIVEISSAVFESP